MMAFLCTEEWQRDPVTNRCNDADSCHRCRAIPTKAEYGPGKAWQRDFRDETERAFNQQEPNMTKKKEPTTTTTKPAGLELKPEEVAVLGDLLKEGGWTLTQRRRFPVTVDLTDERIVELGAQADDLNIELKVMRQDKNALSAALQREKREKQGEMSLLSRQARTKADTLGRPMTTAQQASLVRQHAKARKAYDQWEEDRKATLKAAADALSEKETAHATLCEEIDNGKGIAHAAVLDLTDFASGTVVTVRADNGMEIARRALKEQERQQAMFADLDGAGALTDQEYGWGISGRTNEAVKSYADRHQMPLMKARVIVVALLGKDDELPDEAGGDSEDDDGAE